MSGQAGWQLGMARRANGGIRSRTGRHDAVSSGRQIVPFMSPY